MRKGILLGLALVLMVWGTATESNAQGGPVLEKIWCSPEVTSGSLVKIYVKATDPEGDMRWVVVSAGKGDKPTGSVPIRLGKDMKKDLNGFVYYDTLRAPQKNVSGTAYIMIEDQKGNESEVMKVAVKVVAQGAKAEKPPADFQEVAIGPVLIDAIQRSY